MSKRSRKRPDFVVRKRAASGVSPVYRGRRWVLMLVLLSGIAVLLGRAAYLEIFEQSWLKEQSDKRQLRTVTVPPYRGMIVDRNGEPLAISSPVATVTVNPRKLLRFEKSLKKEIENGKSKESKLAKVDLLELNEKIGQLESILGFKRGEFRSKLKRKSSKHYLYIARHINPEKAQQLVALNIPTIETNREFRRFYPMTETISTVVGITNLDDKGIEGIEKVANARLGGRAGKNRVVRDGKRRYVESVETIDSMVSGEDIQLSLDQRIQYVAYKLLKKQVTQLQAKSGSVIVLDTKTGELLAMANMPSFNPNIHPRTTTHKNRAVVNAFEPGSTLKPLTIAAALEARVIGTDVSIETSPGRLKIGKTIIKDPKNHGTLTLASILAKSSNVGVSKVALLMSSKEHWKFLQRVGLGRKPDAGFLSESKGGLPYYDKWGEVDRASHGYGYGISLSLLQLTHAYSVFATGGVLKPVSIYKQEGQVIGQRVMSEKNADAVLEMMRAVVQPGATGFNASVDGYHVAGKTGTAYKYIKNRYSKDKMIVSFIGLAPATNPRFVIAVMIDEPKVAKISGGRLAAPLFSKIMANTLRIMDIPPDALPEVKQAKPIVAKLSEGKA